MITRTRAPFWVESRGGRGVMSESDMVRALLGGQAHYARDLEGRIRKDSVVMNDGRKFWRNA